MAETIRERQRRRTSKYGTKRNQTVRLNVNYNIQMFTKFCEYALSENQMIGVTGLENLLKVLKASEVKHFSENESMMLRYLFAIDAIELRLRYGSTIGRDLLLTTICGLVGNKYENLDIPSFQELSDGEVKWVEDVVTNILDTQTVNKTIESLNLSIADYINGSPENYFENAMRIKEIINGASTQFNENYIDTNTDETDFLLSNPRGPLDLIINRKKQPSYKLKTGMHRFNDILSGGFEGSRVYCLFGLPGEGKTTTLLNIFYQIKKYNTNFKCKDKTKKPLLLFFTMENTMREAVDSLYTISCGTDKDMAEFTTDQVLEQLAEEGMVVNESSPINMAIRYKPINSVDVSYLHQMTEDFANRGYEVIGVLFDYIKRIKPIDNYQMEERFKLGAVINDLKNFANRFDIPVITASQINREGAKTVDEIRNNSKKDVTDGIGRANIGESSLIDENVDATIFIVPQWVGEEKYMGFKVTKTRYKCTATDRTFFQPFDKTNTIKLVEDSKLASPLSVLNLSGSKKDIMNGAPSEMYRFDGSVKLPERENKLLTEPSPFMGLDSEDELDIIPQPTVVRNEPKEDIAIDESELLHPFSMIEEPLYVMDDMDMSNGEIKVISFLA